VPNPTTATTRRHEYHNRGTGGRGTREREAGNHKWGSGGSHATSRGGEDHDPIDQSPKNKKKLE